MKFKFDNHGINYGIFNSLCEIPHGTVKIAFVYNLSILSPPLEKD